MWNTWALLCLYLNTARLRFWDHKASKAKWTVHIVPLDPRIPVLCSITKGQPNLVCTNCKQSYALRHLAGIVNAASTTALSALSAPHTTKSLVQHTLKGQGLAMGYFTAKTTSHCTETASDQWVLMTMLQGLHRQDSPLAIKERHELKTAEIEGNPCSPLGVSAPRNGNPDLGKIWQGPHCQPCFSLSELSSWNRICWTMTAVKIYCRTGLLPMILPIMHNFQQLSYTVPLLALITFKNLPSTIAFATG